MRIELDYGRSTRAVEIPDDCDVTVIRKQPVPTLPDPAAAVARAFESPIGSTTLQQAARGKASACILICDITRPVPNHLFLQPMIRQMIEGGIPREAITVLVATGLHRPNEGDELAELLGDPWVLRNVRVENHFARDIAAHVDLGHTRARGTPVKLDRRFVQAQLRVATGLVEPHFMAGYSGGRKVIAPGIAHEDTIRTFHNARFMEDPAAIQCNLQGNPLHEEQLEIVAMLGAPIFALNTVLDEKRNLTHVNFGDIGQSHLKAVDFVTRSSAVAVPRRFSTVVTSAAGYPLDRTYYQTVKGMVTPIDILEPGAHLIVASDCSEGLGSAEYRAAQRRLVERGIGQFLADIIDKPLAEIDEWQTEMQLKPMRKASIHLYSEGLSRDDAALTGVARIDSLNAAVLAGIAASGDRAVAVIPEGPYVVPYFQPARQSD